MYMKNGKPEKYEYVFELPELSRLVFLDKCKESLLQVSDINGNDDRIAEELEIIMYEKLENLTDLIDSLTINHFMQIPHYKKGEIL